jgi:hypothetical protein
MIMHSPEKPQNIIPLDRLRVALEESQTGSYSDPATKEQLPNSPYKGVEFADFSHPGTTSGRLDITARIAASYDNSQPPSSPPKTPASKLGKIIQFPKRPSHTDIPEPPQAS